MKNILFGFLVIFSILIASFAQAAADIEINSPAISSIKSSMQARHTQLAPFYGNGALNSLVAAENSDRSALYKEIAVANGHPEWEAEIRSTFAQRWIQKAQSGWWVQEGGGWVKR